MNREDIRDALASGGASLILKPKKGWREMEREEAADLREALGYLQMALFGQGVPPAKTAALLKKYGMRTS